MTKNELKNRIATALQVDPSELQDNSNPKTIIEWDSVGALNILSALDEITNGDVSPTDAQGFVNYAGIVEFMQRKGLLTE